MTERVHRNTCMIDPEPRALEGFEVWMLSMRGVIVT